MIQLTRMQSRQKVDGVLITRPSYRTWRQGFTCRLHPRCAAKGQHMASRRRVIFRQESAGLHDSENTASHLTGNAAKEEFNEKGCQFQGSVAHGLRCGSDAHGLQAAAARLCTALQLSELSGCQRQVQRSLPVLPCESAKSVLLPQPHAFALSAPGSSPHTSLGGQSKGGQRLQPKVCSRADRESRSCSPYLRVATVDILHWLCQYL